MYYTSIRNADVLRTLTQLSLLLSPAGLAAFLGGSIGPYLAKRAGQRFALEGDDVTGPWAPLKESTILMRESMGYGAGPINRRTGELENWVVGSGWNAYPTAMGASMQFPKSEPAGELRVKLKTAQKGKSYPSTQPRPVLGVNEKDLIFLQTALSLAIEKAVR